MYQTSHSANLKSVFHFCRKILEKGTFVCEKPGGSKKFNEKFKRHCLESWSLCFSKICSEFIANELFRIVYFIVWIDFMFKAYVAVIENDICTNTQPNVKK